jgi:exonuclease III
LTSFARNGSAVSPVDGDHCRETAGKVRELARYTRSPGDTQGRYIEAAVKGVIVGCRYLPNGNPAPGPRFDYKLRWFERLTEHSASLLASGAPVVLAGRIANDAPQIWLPGRDRTSDQAVNRRCGDLEVLSC